jgi:hypothetical protein
VKRERGCVGRYDRWTVDATVAVAGGPVGRPWLGGRTTIRTAIRTIWRGGGSRRIEDSGKRIEEGGAGLDNTTSDNGGVEAKVESDDVSGGGGSGGRGQGKVEVKVVVDVAVTRRSFGEMGHAA